MSVYCPHATGKGLSYRSKEHRNADGLLGACHLGGIELAIGFNESLWSAGLWARDACRRMVLSVRCQIAQLSPRDLFQGFSGAERGKASRRVGRERRRQSPAFARLEKQVAELNIAAFFLLSRLTNPALLVLF